MNDTMNYLITALLIGIAGLLLSAFKLGKAFVDVKTEELKSKIKDQEIKNAVTQAEDCIWTVVQQLANETVDDLKTKAVDGKLTPLEVENLRTQAYTRSKQLMGETTYKLLQIYTNDVQGWLLTKIDAYARNTKTDLIKASPIINNTTNTTDVTQNITTEPDIQIPISE